MKEESFDCICGKHFETTEEMQDHFKKNNIGTTGRPHYRLITSGSNPLEGEVPWSEMPPMHKDGPQ